MNGFKSVVVCWSLLAPTFLLGCGGETAPKIPESGQRLIEARNAIESGDNAVALAALQASIDSEPNVWAYLERAKLNAKLGNDAAVEEDCVAILKIDLENHDVPWLRSELKKPAKNRLQAGAEPPSANK